MARYDTSRRRWRHLDFGACQVRLEADIHRINCRSCSRVRTEQMSWARPSARHTTREQIPQARICLDPFHVIKWTNEVVESVYRAEAPTMPSGPGMPERRDWRRALEGINAKIRLIQRRGFGLRNLDALTAAIFLCLGGVTLDLPTET